MKKKDFTKELGDCALNSAKCPAMISFYWGLFLEQVLNYWHHEIKIELNVKEAVDLMLDSCGFGGNKAKDLFVAHHLHHDNAIMDYSRKNRWFWFNSTDKMTSIIWVFITTIAIFESILYGIWYDHNNGIVFNEVWLTNNLKYGNINIDFDKYNEFEMIDDEADFM